MIKNLKFKIGGIVRISNYNSIFSHSIFQIGLNKFLWLKKLKTLLRRHMLLVTLKEKKLLERFTKRIAKKQIKESLALKN